VKIRGAGQKRSHHLGSDGRDHILRLVARTALEDRRSNVDLCADGLLLLEKPHLRYPQAALPGIGYILAPWVLKASDAALGTYELFRMKAAPVASRIATNKESRKTRIATPSSKAVFKAA
jgi:hypothetical protein